MLSNDDKTKLLNTMLEAAKAASKKILQIYKDGFNIQYKEDKSPLTDADLASNKTIREMLKPLVEKYQIAWLSEEDADNKERLKNDKVIIVDPLDGTADFVKKDDSFSINIAYVENRRPVLSLIAVPCKNLIMYAIKDNGCYYIDENGTTVKCHTNNKSKDLIFVSSISHPCEKETRFYKKHEDLISKVIPMGACTKAFAIAKGDADCCVRFTSDTKEWDVCAADLIVHEAGGIFVDPNGKEFIYNRENVYNPFGYCIFNNRETLEKLL